MTKIYIFCLFMSIVLCRENEYYNKVYPGTYTFVATIFNLGKNNYPKPICLGTIIHSMHVVTSCRCFISLPQVKIMEQVKVVAGDVNTYFNLRDPQSSAHRQTREPSKWHESEECRKVDGPNDYGYPDISFIHLRFPFIFNDYVGMINMVKEEFFTFFDKMSYYKWSKHPLCRRCRAIGRTSYLYSKSEHKYLRYSDVLWSQEVDILDDDSCAKKFCAMSNRTYCPSTRDLIAMDTICVVSHESYRICDGDMGSPLICHKEPLGYLMGVPYGNCSDKKFPLLYTSHSKDIEFMKAETIGAAKPMSSAFGFYQTLPKNAILLSQIFLAIKTY